MIVTDLFESVPEQGVAEGPTDDPRFQKMMGNIQKSTPALVSGYVALNFASEQRSKKIKGVSQNGKPMPDVIDNPEEFLSGKIEFTPDQVEKQLTAIGKKYGWDSIDSGQGQGYTEMFFDTSKEYTSNNQNLLAANIANTVSAINKFFNGMNSSLQATGLPGYKTDVWQGIGPPNDTNQIGDLSQIANIAKGKSAKSDPGTDIGKMILKYIPSYEAENDELGYDPEDFANAMAIAKVYIAQGEEAGLRAQLRAEMHVSEMIDEILSDAGGSGLRTMSSDDLVEGHGNYAGDRPVNLGGVSMKMIQTGDTVKYIDQQAQVVDMSQDRKYSRITIPSSSTTKTVLTSDLRQLGQGMAEGSEESYMIIRTDAEGKKDVFAGNFDTYERAQKELDACLAHPLHTKYKQKFEIKRKGQQGVSEADDEHLDEFNLKDLGSKIFGSKVKPVAPTQAAVSGGAQRQAYAGTNPATGQPWTGDELRAKHFPTAPATTGAAMPAKPYQIPGAVTNPVNPTAPTTTTATKPATAATTAAGTFPGEDPQGAGYVGRLEVARRQAARNAQAAKNLATPNAAGTTGTYNKKTGAATLGNKPMLAFKDLPPNIQKQLAGITEALAQPVAELLQMVETKEDVQRIKKFIDDTFVKHGAVNESAFVVRNQILEHVTQVGAQRRRDFAAQQTH